MQTEKLQRAIGAINVRFGDQALVRASRLPAPQPWPTGVPVVDRLSGIGGLPRGRIGVLRGTAGSGRLSLALALLARATHAFARPVVLDTQRRFDPWTLVEMGADLGALTLVRPPTAAAAGEAAVALARAGAGFLLTLGALPESALAPLESAAARSGCLVVAVAEPAGGAGPGQALAYASSVTLELEWLRWVRERGQEIGLRTRVRCVKNKLAAPGAEAELEVRYPLAPRHVPGELLWMVEAPVPEHRPQEDGAAVVELWPDRSAAV